ncbi:hypothetical protein B0H11DRAFT_1941794 [Mycena galericulata]|nr:hypothetical protein B0H11DRAFT_1941794 [Mycena galericulata]
MSLDMNDPQQYGLAMDRLAAGIGPTWALKLPSRNGARRELFLEELQRQRRAETAEETTMRQNRVAALDRLRQNSRKKDAKRAPTRLATALSVPPAPTRLAAALSVSPATSPPSRSEEVVRPLPPTFTNIGCLLDYACFEREADWSDPSSEDEFDPNGILPYCPWYKISSGRAKEMYDQSMRRVVEDAQAELAVKRAMRQRQQAKREMAAVAAQIIQVGAWKKALERAEIGPAPLGFQYVQIGEDIYLARSEWDPSMTIKAPTELPDHLNQYLHLLLLTTTMGCFSPKQQAIPRWHIWLISPTQDEHGKRGVGLGIIAPGWVGKPMGEGSRRETLDNGSVQWGPTQQMSPEHLAIRSTRSRNVRDAKGKKHQKRNGGSRSIV